MVKVIDVGPDPSVVKKVVCRNCGATLEYVKKDIKSFVYYTMGESDMAYQITCPQCKFAIDVKQIY